ncbi:AraC family transcriptional regulator [Flammeovirga sp. SubArs3]|uniref:helix-turn-helix domain-containing protein n=1 Tax=Flammeovirga sp. SubArs3 TaxID=2995316 RepID=UPI00248C9A4F|nr:AraC family transcriptional regulator [Flammeovirga sp. SubArs3]
MSKSTLTLSLENWNNIFQGKIVDNKIIMPDAIGVGCVIGYEVNSDIEVLSVQFLLKERVEVLTETIHPIPEKKAIYFGRHIDTDINVVTKVGENKYKVEKKLPLLELGAFSTNLTQNLIWSYPANVEYKIVIIRIAEGYYQSLIDRSTVLQQLFNGKEDFYVFEEFDLNMKETYDKINKLNPENIFFIDQLEALSQYLVVTFFQQLSGRSDTTEKRKYPFNIEPIFKAQEIIRNSLHEQLNIASITKQIGMSESRLRFLFKKVFDSTIHNYHIQLRLDEAKRMLKEKEKTNTAIAMDLGFSSASHFSMVFKKHFNITPKEYRNQLKGNE